MSLSRLLLRLFGHTQADGSGQGAAEDVIQSRRERAEVLRQQSQNRKAMVKLIGIEADVVTRRRGSETDRR